MNFPVIQRSQIPHLRTDQMVEVDRLMTDDYKVGLIQMMENAGRHLGSLARRRFLSSSAKGRRVHVYSGPGGNGGGALVAARRLHNWGAEVRVYLSAHPDDMRGVPAHQLELAERMGIAVYPPSAVPEKGWADVSLDGLIGYGLLGDPRGHSAVLIQAMNSDDAPALALDTPSGLDTSTGVPATPTVRATATMTLALPKVGLGSDSARPLVGELYLADIGVPPELYASPSLGLEVGHLFSESDIVRVEQAQ
jgi:NAD(P)H-hydrate epimerase